MRLLALLVLLLSINQSISQCITYPDSYEQYFIQSCAFNSSNNYATPITLSNWTLLDPTTYDDGYSRVRQPLPFPIWIYGVPWDWIYISVNSALFFGPTPISVTTLTIPVSNTYADAIPIIAALWTDLYWTSTDPAQKIVYATEGLPGSRQYIIRFERIRWLGTSTNPNLYASFDYIFYENLRGYFEIRYHAVTSTASSLNLGIQSYDDGGSSWSLYRSSTAWSQIKADLEQRQLSFQFVGQSADNITCGGLGFNFNTLRGNDLSFTDVNNTRWIINPCSEVVDSICSGTSSTEKAMICQIQLGAPYDLGVWGPNSARWQYPPDSSQGVEMVLQDGAYCSLIAGSRWTTVRFVCDATATTAQLVNAVEEATCVYRFTIRTSLACGGGVRQNTTEYARSSLANCNRVNGAGYFSSLCPRDRNNLVPLSLAAPTRILANVASGTALIPINFPFFFYGRQFSQVYASMHGSLWFGAAYTGTPSTFPTLGVAATAIDNFPAIIAFGTSMTGVAYAGFTAPNITYSSATVDGRRSLVIRYWGMKYTAYRGLYDMVISFDIILSEGEPGGVQIKYYEVTANPAVAVSIGVHGPDDMNNYAGYISGELMTSAIANTLQGATLNFTYTGRLSTDGCAAFGVNFTNAITRDLTWTDGSATYYINPCRALTTTNPCRPGTTVCQVVGGVGTVVSTFNPSSVMWASGPNFGVRATMRDGTYCPAIGAARTLIVDWICSQSSTETYVVRAVETSTCVFNIQIFSPIACQSPASCRNIRNPLYNAALCPTAANSPRLALTNESQPLMVGIDDAAVRIRLPFTFWMYGLQYRYCWIGTNGVLALGLRGQEWAYYTFPVQGSNNDALPLIAPLWTDLNPVDSSRITYSNEIINGSRAFVVRYSNVEYFGNVVAGVADTVSFDVIMFEGLTGNMEFRYYGLSAGSYADPVPLVVGIQADDEENFLAVYNGVTVDNAVAASLSNTTLKLSYTGEDQSAAACGGLGYNLTSLSGADLVWNGTPGQQITVRVCGTVADRQCSESSFGDRSMVCQEVLDANNVTSAIYMVSEWKPKAVYYSYPSARSTGVMMINQDGAWCDVAGMPRVVVMDFMCDTTATQARITSWSEPQTCVYVVNITTNAVCGPGARGTVLPNPYPTNSTLTSCVQFRGQSYDASWCPRSVNDTYYWPEVFTPLGRILATDDGGVQLNFNFPFNLYGANEPTVILSSNGLLSFGYGWSPSPNAGPWPTMGFVTSDAYPMVASFWTDMINLETTAGWIPYKGYVEYGRIGTAPNRRVIFRFKDVDYWATRNFLTERSASFDIVLWEGGLIETRFYTIDPAPTQTVLIGMHGYGEEYLPVANLAPLTREYAGQLSGSTMTYRYKGESLSDFCGGIPGGYNLTQLSFEELNFNTTQYQYYLRPCGYVTARVCTAFFATARVSFCQATLDGLTSTSLAIDSSAAGSFSVIDPTTLRLSLASGQMCAAINGPRRVIVDFICDRALTRSILESVTENVPCITVARVRSPFACAGPPTCQAFPGPLYNGLLCSGDPSMGRNILNPTNPTFIHPNLCDDCNGNYVIPFEMRVYGRAYTSVWISTNGWIGFGTAAVSTLSGSLPLSSTSASALPVLTHMFADLANRNAYGNASISYSTEGDAPNRIFLIRYSWVTWLSYQDRPISIDIKLYEGAEGRIDVLYHKVTSVNNVATVGIQSSDGTSYTVVSNNPAAIDGANLEGKMLRWYYTGSDASVNRTCGGLGYDFTSYMGTALSATQGATSVYFSPCSITSAPACLASPATDRSVACAVTGTSSINLGVYSPANNVWTYLSNGVQQYMPIGPWCEVSRGPGILFVNYLCNPSQTTPRMTNFTLTESNCVNQISIETSRACGGGNRNSDGSNSTKPIRSTLTACYTQVGWNVDARVCPRNTTDPFYTPIVQTNPTEILQRVDNAAANVQIPFPFYVYGTPYTELNITSDGLLTFGPGSTVGTANTFLGTMPIAENSWPVIAAFWSDLWNGGSPGELEYPGYIKWSIEGTPPTRKMVIRYYMLDYILYRWYPSVTGVSFDVFLHEGTAGNVDIHYYRVDPNPTTYVTLGMRANDRSTLAYTAVHNWELLTAERTNQLAGATVSFRYTGNAVATACGAFGLNLTSIRDIDMSYTNPSTGRTYYHRACGVVQAAVCRSAPVTEHSTLCETTGNTPLYSATQFNPASVTWTSIPNGIQSTQQTGTYCPTPLAAPRIAVIQYICNATANPPALRSVTVVDGCTYTAVVHTTAVCVGSSSSSTGAPQPSSSSARQSSTAAPSSSSATVATSSARPSSTAAPSSTVVPSSSAARVSSSSSATNVVSSTASTSSTQTQESSTGAIAEPSSSSSSALSDGAIAGIVIGVLVGALMICVAIFFLCCATRQNKAHRLEDEKENVEQSSTGEHNNETAEPEDGEVEMTEV